MFKTLNYHAEYSRIEISLFKGKDGYSFCLMDIYRNGKYEAIADNGDYVTDELPKILDSYLKENKKKVFKELGLEKDELTTQGAIELQQIIKKVKNKLCKSKEE